MRMVFLMALVVIFAGLATYLAIGNPRLLISSAPMAPQGPDPDRVAALQAQLQGANEDQVRGTIEGMVAGLRSRLETEGGTVDEWDRLIRSYATLEDVEGLSFALGGLLDLEPENPQALLLAGQVAAQQGDRVQAKAFFMRLLPLIDPEHPRFEQIQTLIQTFDQADPATPSN